MKPNGRTGLVVPTPAADDLLEIVRNLHPASVRPLPAHVSILYPFVPAVEISSELNAELESMATLVKPATVRVATCERHSGFVHLPVDAGHSLATFRETVRRRWPELLPYGGVYGDPQLHLTVAKCSDEATATAIQALVEKLLPISVSVNEAWLVAFSERWFVRGSFPFGGHG